MAKQKADLPVLTLLELETAREACATCTQADRVAAKAKKEKGHALAQVWFKMGFLSEDEVKVMGPALLADAIARRVGRKFELDPKAFAEFALVKTHEGKYPRWKEELLSVAGPAEIARIESETATQYSYTVIEASASNPGTAGVFVLAPEPSVKGKRAATK